MMMPPCKPHGQHSCCNASSSRPTTACPPAGATSGCLAAACTDRLACTWRISAPSWSTGRVRARFFWGRAMEWRRRRPHQPAGQQQGRLLQVTARQAQELVVIGSAPLAPGVACDAVAVQEASSTWQLPDSPPMSPTTHYYWARTCSIVTSRTSQVSAGKQHERQHLGQAEPLRHVAVALACRLCCRLPGGRRHGTCVAKMRECTRTS